MSILQEIVEAKRGEVASLRAWAAGIRSAAGDAPAPRDFEGALRGGSDVSLIAEVKRRSPGAGEIRAGLNAPGLAVSYREAGASAVSVLTDESWFGGSLDDLRGVRDAVDLPILRKDFVLDPVQVWEARSAGADAVLLIVAILDGGRLEELLGTVREAGMAALVEVHDQAEMRRAADVGADLIGINNRDLRVFETRLETTLELLPSVPEGAAVVSESGISSRTDVERLGGAGVDAVLVGESLLRADDPGEAAARLVGVAREERGR